MEIVWSKRGYVELWGNIHILVSYSLISSLWENIIEGRNNGYGNHGGIFLSMVSVGFFSGSTSPITISTVVLILWY